MVDDVRVLRLLRAVSDDLSVLRAEAVAGPSRRQDPIWLRGVKYAFVTAIEACVDCAQHLCSSQGWGPPSDNGDAMRLLGEHGVVPPPLATAMRQAVGFRNVLVQEYVTVDDTVVLVRLQDLSDLDGFVAAVAHYVSGVTDT